METLKKIWQWVTTHLKLVSLFAVIILLTIFILWWGRKNSKIRSLENQLAILTAKVKIEKLAMQYDAKVAELKTLKEKDDKLSADIASIETSLTTRLRQDMTAEEIAAKFREIGIR
jgi:cell division protein FtsB